MTMSHSKIRTRTLATEQRSAARQSGRFVEMDTCEHCGKRGALEPAFGGDPSDGADSDPIWGKLVCQKCVKAALKRLASPAEQ